MEHALISWPPASPASGVGCQKAAQAGAKSRTGPAARKSCGTAARQTARALRHGRCMGLGRPAARPQPPTERLEGRPVSGLADRRRRRAASGEGAPGLLRGPGLPAPALNGSGQEAQWLPRARGALAVGVWFPLTVAGAAQALRPGRMPLRHGLKTRTCFPFNPLTARKQPWGTCQAGRRPFRMRWRMGARRRPGAIVAQRGPPPGGASACAAAFTSKGGAN